MNPLDFEDVLFEYDSDCDMSPRYYDDREIFIEEQHYNCHKIFENKGSQKWYLTGIVRGITVTDEETIKFLLKT